MKRKILSTLLVIGALSFSIPTYATEVITDVVSYEETVASEEGAEETEVEAVVIAENSEEATEDIAETEEETAEAGETICTEVAEETIKEVEESQVEAEAETNEEIAVITDGEANEAEIIELPEISVTQEYHAVDADVVGDMVVDDSLKLANNCIVNGDLTIYANLELNGYNLQVNGNVYAESSLYVGDGNLTVTGNYLNKKGVLGVDVGKIDIGGDLLIYGVNASGEKVTGNGDLSIGTSGTLTVGGNMILNTSSSMNSYIDGTITVKGNLIEEKAGSYGFESACVVLAGSNVQTLQLSEKSYIKNLQLQNPKVKMAGYTNAKLGTNANEITLDDGVFQTNGFNLNGYNMTIPGDVVAESSIEVGGATLTVTGNHMQKNGVLNVSSGKAIINGDLNVYSLNASNEKVTGNGDLTISNESGTITVGGNMILNTSSTMNSYLDGTITVKGNLIEEKAGSYGFKPACVVMAGSNEQTLQLSDKSYIGNLQLQNPKVKFAGYTNAKLGTNANEVTLADGVFRTNGLTLNGYNMTIPGDVVAEGSIDVAGATLTVTGNHMQKDGNLYVTTGKAVINGDLNLYSVNSASERVTGSGDITVGNESGMLTVGGNMILNTSSTMSAYIDGTVTVKGNLIEEKAGSYGLTLAHLVLAGSEEQTLQLTKDSYVKKLELQNPKVKMAGMINGVLASHATEITLDDGVFQTNNLQLNGYNMTIPGDVVATGGISVGSGTLTVTGNLRQENGNLSIGGGKAVINGDFNIYSLNEQGEMVVGSGDLYFDNESGMLIVDGDMILNTSATVDSYLLASITVKGDLIEEKAGKYGFAPRYLIMAGSEEQTLQLTNASYVKKLELKNPKVKMVGYINAKMNSHATEIILDDGVFQTSNLDLNGYSMTIPGDVVATGNINAGNGTLTITGNLRQESGTLYLLSGKVNINGNLDVFALNEQGENVVGSGDLCLENESGMLIVDGNMVLNTSAALDSYLVASITVKGDLIEEKAGKYGFKPKYVIMAGSEEQTLQLTNASYVKKLELKNPKVKMAGYINATLVSDAKEITLDDGIFQTSDLNLNGYTMNVPGNMEASGSVSMNKGTLNVTGDYMQKSGCLYVDNGKTVINGNLQVYTTDVDGNATTGTGSFSIGSTGNLVVNKSLLLNTTSRMSSNLDGTITIKGDLLQECAIGSAPYFKPKYVIMAGSGAQKINFTSSNAWIGTLELKQKTKFYTINPKPCYDKLIDIKTLVTKITLNKTSVALKMNESTTLTATVAPTDADIKTVTWSSSNTKVATVDANGKVTAKALGTAVIKATAQDTSKVSASCTVKITAVPAKPYKITNVVSGVHVYWKDVAGASKYGLWRSENGANGTYKWIANPTVAHFTDTTAVSGKTYHYKVTAVDVDGKHGDKSEAIGVVYVSTPDITSRINKAAGIQLGWNKITGATGYAIYRKSYAGTDAWARVGTISGNSTFTWTDTGVKNSNGTVYRYTVRALAGSDMKTLSGCRNTGRTMTRLSSRVLNSATKVTGGIECKWTTSAAVTGYEVRFMVGSDVVKTFTIGNYKTGSMVFKGLTAGKTYKIQVRSYKKVTGVGSFYSAWSEAKTVKY